MSRLPLVLATVAVFLIAACGGDDRKEFLEQSTGATGDRAKDACKQQLRAVTGLRVKLVRIRTIDIDDDRVTVTAVLQTQGRRQPRLLRLKREDGDWKLAGGRGE